MTARTNLCLWTKNNEASSGTQHRHCERGVPATTADPGFVVGRKIAISPDEVVALVGLLKKLGAGLLARLPSR
jgi:hypothetical protein